MMVMTDREKERVMRRWYSIYHRLVRFGLLGRLEDIIGIHDILSAAPDSDELWRAAVDELGDQDRSNIQRRLRTLRVPAHWQKLLEPTLDRLRAEFGQPV